MSVDDRVRKTKKIVVASVGGVFVAWMAMVFALRQMWVERGEIASTPLAAASRTLDLSSTPTHTAVAAVTSTATPAVVEGMRTQVLTPSGASAGGSSAGDLGGGGGRQMVGIVIAGLLTLILGSVIGWLAGWLIVARQGGSPPRWLWGRVLLAGAALAVILFVLVLSPVVDLSPTSVRGGEAVARLSPTSVQGEAAPEATYTAYPTSTAYPTNTPYPTATSYPTDTPMATYTPYPTYTSFPTSTPTRRPTATTTEVPLATATEVPVATATEVPTRTPTATPTLSPTATPTPEPTSTLARATELPTTGASLSGSVGLVTVLVLFALLIGGAVWEARQTGT